MDYDFDDATKNISTYIEEVMNMPMTHSPVPTFLEGPEPDLV